MYPPLLQFTPPLPVSLCAVPRLRLPRGSRTRSSTPPASCPPRGVPVPIGLSPPFSDGAAHALCFIRLCILVDYRHMSFLPQVFMPHVVMITESLLHGPPIAVPHRPSPSSACRRPPRPHPPKNLPAPGGERELVVALDDPRAPALIDASPPPVLRDAIVSFQKIPPPTFSLPLGGIPLRMLAPALSYADKATPSALFY